MMFNRFLIFLFSLGIAGNSFAQADSLFIPAKMIRGDISDFTVDNLGNLFILYQNGQLKKLNPNGDSLAVYNDVRRYGKVYAFDVSNPLKILLYHKDFATIVVLDRFLNVRNIIDLRRHGLFQVKAIGQAYDNNIWVFDDQESRLKRISDEGRLIDQSNDFRTLFDSTPSPQFIVDQNRQLYLYDYKKGIYIFDYYGAFRSRIPFVGWSDFEVINNVVFGRDDKFLYKYEPGSLKLQQYPMPRYMLTAKKIIVTPGKVYLLDNHQISIYGYR
jgi:hypothetical protein